jgi:hypothetical protein
MKRAYVLCALVACNTAPPATALGSSRAASSSSAPASPEAVAASAEATASAAEPPAPAKNEPDPPIVGEPLGSPLSNSPTTSSGSVANADEVIIGLRPKLRACYASARGSGPPIAGMVTCGVRITKQGRVAAVSVVRRDRLPNPLVACIVTELKTARFGTLDEEAHIQVPVRFAVPAD